MIDLEIIKEDLTQTKESKDVHYSLSLNESIEIVCHAKKMLDRAIVAEKALEVLADKIQEIQIEYGCPLPDKDCTPNGCKQCALDWALEKARGQGNERF
jgi:hypothetical protein